MTTTGREYLRVSQDRSGQSRSTTEQHDENQGAARRRDVTLGEPYRDNAVSASRYGRKTRDDFARMLDDIGSGRFGADELWLWEPSRGSRKVSEWVTLLEVCEERGVRIYVTTHSKLYDPANHRDRRSLLEDAVDAEYEVGKTSERVGRGVRSRAAAGRPHGRQLYGYRRVHAETGGGYLRSVKDEVTGPIVVEVFRRFADGESCSVIARTLTQRGIDTARGAPIWRGTTLLSMLKNEGYRGRRVSKKGHAPVEDAWPALIDETTWWRVQARFADPGRAPRGDLTVRHLLSGIATCGVCGGKVGYQTGRKTGREPRPTYSCTLRYCVGRSAPHLEAQVEEFVLTLHEADERVGQAAPDPRLAELEAEHAALAARLEDYRVAGARPDGPSPAAVAVVERELGPQIAALEQQQRQARAQYALPDGLTGGSLRDVWPGLGLRERRDIIASSVTIRVLPAGGARRYNPATVEIRRRW